MIQYDKGVVIAVLNPRKRSGFDTQINKLNLEESMFQLLTNREEKKNSAMRAEALGIYDLQNAVLGNLDDEILYPSKAT